MQVATKIGIHEILFCGDNCTSKNFKKFSQVDSLFNIRQDYSIQPPRTLLNVVTDKLIRMFWNSCAENWRIVRTTYVVFTVYSLLPDCATDTFWKCLERKRFSKISKISKSLCKTMPFSLTLQPCSPILALQPEFLASANTDSKKNVSFEYSKIVGSLQGKGL